MATQLKQEDLLSLEEYDKKRVAYRDEVMAYKQNRRLDVGDHISLYFESETTMRYQIQEMLRIEKVFDQEGIQDELDAYNPLIPDGSNLKATMMIQYEDVDERRVMLGKLLGIENRVWLQVGDHERVFAIANEDLERSTDDKTSSVHFLRYEFSDAMIAAAKAGEALYAGIDHPMQMVERMPVSANVAASIVEDFA